MVLTTTLSRPIQMSGNSMQLVGNVELPFETLEARRMLSE